MSNYEDSQPDESDYSDGAPLAYPKTMSNMLAGFFGAAICSTNAIKAVSYAADYPVSNGAEAVFGVNVALAAGIGYLAIRDDFLQSWELKGAAYVGIIAGALGATESWTSWQTVGAISLPFIWNEMRYRLSQQSQSVG